MAHQQKVAFSKGFMNLMGDWLFGHSRNNNEHVPYENDQMPCFLRNEKSMCVGLMGCLSHNGTDIVKECVMSIFCMWNVEWLHFGWN